LNSSNFNPAVALRYAAFLQRTKDLARADDVLTEVANRNPGNLEIDTALAQVRLARQRWPSALALAAALPSNKEGRVLAAQIKAAALEGQNKFDESVAVLEAAHRAVPDAVRPLVALASAYIRHGKADQATALLQDMSRRYPANARLLVLLGE